MGQIRRPPRIDLPDPIVVDALRRMTSEECFALIGEANETARALSAAGIRHLHPDWSDEQVRAEVARRMLSEAG
jgi:hypothetical protein